VVGGAVEDEGRAFECWNLQCALVQRPSNRHNGIAIGSKMLKNVKYILLYVLLYKKNLQTSILQN